MNFWGGEIDPHNPINPDSTQISSLQQPINYFQLQKSNNSSASIIKPHIMTLSQEIYYPTHNPFILTITKVKLQTWKETSQVKMKLIK